MEDDGDADSQLSVLATSLSWWMMKNLWKQGTSDEKLRLSVVDTFFLKDGHLECWYFTSSKSGSVLKHASKRLEWDGLVKFLLRRARSTWGTAKDSWTPVVIAMARRLRGNKTYPIMLTASDLKDLREKHNVHLLDEIVAIQPYVTKKPFAGCGLFETEFERKGRHRSAQAALATYELARWPAEDVQWFQEFEPCVDSPDDRDCRRRRDSSAKRVHGVIHRVLAMTTKGIVEHVERETEEVLLRVVAQYIFLPGSGQPTLLWLDSVETLSSTQQDDPTTEDEAEADGNEAFMQLTRELGEVSRGWTTFFPPKMGDLTDGGSIMGGGLSLSLNPRAGCSARETNGSLQVDVSSKGGSRLSRYPAAIGLTDGSTVGTTAATPLSPEERQSVGDVHEAEDGFLAIDRISDKGVITGEKEVDLTAPSAGRAAGDRRGHFTLPTESWARRSAGWRGLYFSGGGGDGGAERPSSEQWPRRRSTGTTMRRDGRRPDLRSASETRRPWTAPARVLEEAGDGAQEGNWGVKDGVISRRLAGSNGCYGDYCQCKGMMEIGGSGVGGGRGHHADNDRSPPSKMVSYISILKCRAEGKALTLRSHTLAKAGRHGAFEGVPMLGASGETELQPQNKETVEGGGLLPLIAQRMGLLATSLGDQGRGEYFGLCSSDRAMAGVPESAQRAIEELLYEEVLSRLHPTTVNRSVTVCDVCATVYSYMDAYRKQGKHLRGSADENFRGAYVALKRKLRRRGQRGDDASNRPHAGSTTGGHTSPLRRYSELNLLKPTPIVSPTVVRPNSREGSLASSSIRPKQQLTRLSRPPAANAVEASKSGKGHRGMATKNGSSERREPADGDRTIAELRGLHVPTVTRRPAGSMRKTGAAGSRDSVGKDSRSRTR